MLILGAHYAPVGVLLPVAPLALDAGNPFRTDQRRMGGARREVEPVAGVELDALPGGQEVEADGAFEAVEDLAVGVGVSAIDGAGAVRPGVRAVCLGIQPLSDLGFVDHQPSK